MFRTIARARFGGRLFAAAAVASLLVGTACLGTLPEATQCPPPPRFPSCPLHEIGAGSPVPVGIVDGGVAPVPTVPVSASSCNLEAIPCVQQQHRACQCTPDAECRRGTVACNPPPDCPKSIREANPGATCLTTTASAQSDASPQSGSSSGVQPPVGGGNPGVGSSSADACLCGCASCAATCDGQGPIIGAGSAIRFDLPSNLPPSGQIGVMARLRGGGQAIVSVRTLDGPESLVGPAPADSDFDDALVRNGPGAASYAWSGAQIRPVALIVHAPSDGPIEVDCVVPFLTR